MRGFKRQNSLDNRQRQARAADFEPYISFLHLWVNGDDYKVPPLKQANSHSNFGLVSVWMIILNDLSVESLNGGSKNGNF